MTAPTPAVKRAEKAFASEVKAGSNGDGWYIRIEEGAMSRAVAAALTDPDDPDSLARTLYVLHWSVDGRETPTFATSKWGSLVGPAREHWRAVADGLRATLTGSGS